MWELAKQTLTSRLLVGSAGYPSLHCMQEAIRAAKTNVITVSIKREAPQGTGGEDFWAAIKQLNCHILPNTAGCKTAESAIKMAEIARELFSTNWIKLEVINDEYNLDPNAMELIKACKVLIREDFTVFPYCSYDLSICQNLVDLGCEILMPWGAPIGSGLGLLNPYALQTLRERLANITLIIDAGIGSPAHATQAMELGFDGVLINSAIANATQPINMAKAFQKAVNAGRLAYTAGIMPKRTLAKPSTPLIDTPFWQQEVNLCKNR